MCGIGGYVTTNGQRPDAAVVEAMMAPLAARGPDDEGSYVDSWAALGHRRLSIIDLDSGRQPLANEDGTIQVILNGEIYNYRELRRHLIAQGHRFRTQSDAEVVVHLYEDHGERLVEQLNGMFALAVWDAPRRRLLLARDRMGKKPLYWTQYDGGLAFASELKSLQRHPKVERRLDLRGMARYLLHGYIPSPWSIYEGIYKLDRSACLSYEHGRVRVWRWWQPPARLLRPLPDFRTAAEGLWERLSESVRRRLVSDVPLGVFLSGGIDSSSVVAGMRRWLPPEQIQTFTIGFDDPSYDESPAARQVARYFGTQHHQETFTGQQMLDILPEVADYLDEPFADASVLPTYLLSGFARQWVKVALGGDGGDELLAGYPTFVVHRTLREMGRLPIRVRRGLSRLITLLPVSHRHMSADFLLRQYLRGLDHLSPLAHQIWMGAVSPQEQPALLSAEVRQELDRFDLVAELFERYRKSVGPDPLGQLLDFYAQTYLQEGVLAKVDRASMAHGLEVRAPFLDPDVVEFLMGLPARYKLRGLQTKRILKRAMRSRLPFHVVHRTKHGFGMPVAAWLNGPLKSLAADLLAAPRLKDQGVFNPATVERLLCEHWGRQANHARALWTLLMFQLWCDRWASDATAPRARTPARLSLVH